MAAVKFEQAMARLEAIVGELEKSDLPLDESLKIFEEGIRLSKNCLKVLEEAEYRGFSVRLPSDWYSAVDPASGETYYFNTATKEVTWVRPKM